MKHARHEKGVAEFHLIDHFAIELKIFAALEDQIPDRCGAEIEFLEKLVHVLRASPVWTHHGKLRMLRLEPQFSQGSARALACCFRRPRRKLGWR